MKWYQPVSEEIFQAKYMLHGENDSQEVFSKVAKEIADAETGSNKKKWEKIFYTEMENARFIPAGRILANARPESKMKNYNNCFTIDIEDSMDKIYDSLKEDALISKMGGGVGFDVSKLRPAGSILESGGKSSGSLSFLRIFDQSAKTIMTGGFRRSAHIALLDISHPDVEEFIDIKQGDSNKELTQFNISVKITDDFIKAVEDNSNWDLVHNGTVYKTVKATDLYDKLAKHAYIHNEPGVFFQDRVEEFNNGYWAFKMDRVNPCGELVMPSYSLCCLGAVNLSKFVKNPFTEKAEFDFESFKFTAAVGIRFLDNVLDKTLYPLDKIEDFSRQWRRVGLGFTALADTLAMLRLVYGSNEAVAMAGKISKALRDASYDCSAELAKEKGPFTALDKDKLLNANFIKQLPDDILAKIKQNGLRNIQMNTVAPTGTISLSVGQNCSSGIEPIFALQYYRTIRTGDGEDTVKELIKDFGWMQYCELNPDVTTETKPKWFITAPELDPYKSIDLQAEVQKYIDHSISRTLNLPRGFTFDQYKDLFLYGFKCGLKGFTTFNPEGSMKGILEYNDETNRKRIIRGEPPKRPETLKCDVYRMKAGNKNHIIIPGMMEGSLFEVFCIDEDPSDPIALPDYCSGSVTKRSAGIYDLILSDKYDGTVISDFNNKWDSTDSSLARFVSMALRSGTPLQFIIDQLNKDTNFLDFERAMARVLKKYIKDGEEVVTGEKECPECNDGLVFRDGCVVCPGCGWSKCS